MEEETKLVLWILMIVCLIVVLMGGIKLSYMLGKKSICDDYKGYLLKNGDCINLKTMEYCKIDTEIHQRLNINISEFIKNYERLNNDTDK